MLPTIREKFEGQEFENLSHLVQRVFAFESQHWTLRREKYLKGTATVVNPYDADSKDEDDLEVAITEWTWGKAPISCPWVKETENAHDFDIRRPIRSLIYCWKRSS